MSRAEPISISRRSFIATSLAALAAMRCGSAVPPLSGVSMLPGGVFRLRSRPGDSAGGVAGGEPKPLGLSRNRDGVYYVPPAARRELPLILLLHGARGSGTSIVRRFIPYADRVGAILVGPDSRGATWDLTTESIGADAPFIDRALDVVFRSCRVDSRRVSVAGFSDGASMALTLGLTNGDLFSAIAAFSPGVLAVGADYRGTPRVFIAHGTADDILPFKECGAKFVDVLRRSGYRVEFRPFDGKHTYPPAEIFTSAVDDLVT